MTAAVARNRTVVGASPGAVFAVLCDPRAYSGFVVGNQDVRGFDPTWPDVESALHHTLGVGPCVVHDLTRVVEMEQDRRLVLRAQMRPFSVNRVAFTLRPVGEGTEVQVEEHPLEGPMSLAWNPAFDRLLWLRNEELLGRLGRLVERRVTSPPAAVPS